MLGPCHRYQDRPPQDHFNSLLLAKTFEMSVTINAPRALGALAN